MKVLLIDTTQFYPTSPLFAEALGRACERDGTTSVFVDEGQVFSALVKSNVERVAHRLRPWPHRRVRGLHQDIVAQATAFQPDVILAVKAAHLTPACLEGLRRSTRAVLVNYSTDDPFNTRTSSRTWLRALPLYDVVCSPRQANIDDLRTLGVPRVEYVPFGYKRDVHFPEQAATPDEVEAFRSDACFIGGADDDRAPYFESLIAAVPGINLALYGSFWGRYPRLAKYWRGVATGRSFRLAISGSAIVINLVRRANRDDHVMRTFEVPACGGCVLMESTPAHRRWFRDDVDGVFFASPVELIQQVERLLAAPQLRADVAAAGRATVTATPHSYDDRLAEILRIAADTKRSRS